MVRSQTCCRDIFYQCWAPFIKTIVFLTRSKVFSYFLLSTQLKYLLRSCSHSKQLLMHLKHVLNHFTQVQLERKLELWISQASLIKITLNYDGTFHCFSELSQLKPAQFNGSFTNLANNAGLHEVFNYFIACSPNAASHDLPGSYECSCHDGFTGTGYGKNGCDGELFSSCAPIPSSDQSGAMYILSLVRSHYKRIKISLFLFTFVSVIQ